MFQLHSIRTGCVSFALITSSNCLFFSREATILVCTFKHNLKTDRNIVKLKNTIFSFSKSCSSLSVAKKSNFINSDLQWCKGGNWTVLHSPALQSTLISVGFYLIQSIYPVPVDQLLMRYLPFGTQRIGINSSSWTVYKYGIAILNTGLCHMLFFNVLSTCILFCRWFFSS